MRRPLLFLKSLLALLLGRPLTLEHGRRPLHLYPDGTVLPAIAGADGEGSGSGDGGEGGSGEGGSGEGGETGSEGGGSGEEEEQEEEGKEEEDLGEAGKAALEKERKARREAEKARKAAEEKAKQYEDEQLSEKERAEKRAEEAEQRSTEATAKVRRANLLTTLADEFDLTGGKGKAAARLLADEVEYDDEDQPTNLTDAVEAAKAEYGEDVFKGATPAAAGKADQGAREGANQLSSTEGMSPGEIAKAVSEGRLDEYLKSKK